MKKMLYMDPDGATYFGEISSGDLGELLRLSMTESENWSASARGQELGTLTDHGNGVHIVVEGMRFDLDYSQLHYLRLLINGMRDMPSSNIGELPDRYELKVD